MKPPTPHPADVFAGQNIRRWRRIRNLTQKQLADRVGITMQQIWKYETAASRIAVSRLVEMADVLDVPPSVILGEGPAAPPPCVDADRERQKILSLLNAMSDLQVGALIRVIQEVSGAIADSDSDASSADQAAEFEEAVGP